MSGMAMHHVRRVFQAAEHLGADPVKLRDDVGIEASALDELDRRVPPTQLRTLWGEAAARTGEESFGLRLVELSRPYPPDHVLGYAVMTSATLGDAYRRVVRYVRLVDGSLSVSLDLEGYCAHVRLGVHASEGPGRHGVEYALGMLYEPGRRTMGDAFSIREARFEHGAPRSVELHERVFGAPVRFDQPRTELVFDARLLATSLGSADPALCAILERHMMGLIDGVPAVEEVFTARVRQAVVSSLRDGTPTAQSIAKGLGCSARTMHRRLAEEGGGAFQELLDDVRREAAVRHLREGRIEISGIAFVLGFSEVSAFYRAFKRWTGRTPVEYRRGEDGASGTRQPS